MITYMYVKDISLHNVTGFELSAIHILLSAQYDKADHCICRQAGGDCQAVHHCITELTSALLLLILFLYVH